VGLTLTCCGQVDMAPARASAKCYNVHEHLNYDQLFSGGNGKRSVVQSTWWNGVILVLS